MGVTADAYAGAAPDDATRLFDVTRLFDAKELLHGNQDRSAQEFPENQRKSLRGALGQFVELVAAGRTALSQIDILGAMRLNKEELRKQFDDSYLPNDRTNNHDLRLHHKTEGAFEDSIRAFPAIVREEKPKGLRLRFDR